MNHQPATELPSQDESWWATVEEFSAREAALLRSLDWAGVERLAREYFERAESAYAAALFAQSRATSLAALGRDSESLAASELAEQLAPVEPYFKLNLARRLIGEFARPAEGLAKLAEAEPLLEADMRGGWLTEMGLGLLAVGRDDEAVACFRELTMPQRLTRLQNWDRVWLVDLRLVSNLVAKRLVPELCVAYLEAAEAIGVRHEPDKLGPVRDLLKEVRAAGA